MSVSLRRTTIVHGKLAMQELRVGAARGQQHGHQIMTFEQMTARLAGGFARPIDTENLRVAIKGVLTTQLGELDAIKLLPGMVNTAADTLQKAWNAGIDLAARAGENPRFDSIARLEHAVLQELPGSLKRPADLVIAAMLRINYAGAILGSIEIVGITELSPCWRPLLFALAQYVDVKWIAGPRSVPVWLDGSLVSVIRSPRMAPTVTCISASTSYHEAVEAIRWARSLLASGLVQPADIAICATMTAEYDHHFLTLRADAGFDIHFVHGINVTTTREGQTAAALADILTRGLSQTRMRRLATLSGTEAGAFGTFPANWTRVLPNDAPLSSMGSWHQLLDRLTLDDWPDSQDHTAALREIVSQLGSSIDDAAEVGEVMLTGRALTIWRKALLAGPPAALDATLNNLKQDDGLEACTSISWMPASAIAASPRRFVRLLGLNSSRWPRGISEDRLLSDHIIPTAELDPLPVGAADRRDFETILATTETEVVLSRARRDSDGRLLGRSALLFGQPVETYLRRNQVPEHAMSETDRLLGRPTEFYTTPQCNSARSCWVDWLKDEVTSHDGQTRANHPLLVAALERIQSASSLRRLLRNPLGYIWLYALGWRSPNSGEEPLTLDPVSLGNLVHEILDGALILLESGVGMAHADFGVIDAMINAATIEVAANWSREQTIPPTLIWQRTLNEAKLLAYRALTFYVGQPTQMRSFGEVPFGGAPPKTNTELPWDSNSIVEIPGTGISISGYIDRLDISTMDQKALVCDYKTGKPPKEAIVLDGGKELQRCLYAFAVKALLGSGISIRASLLFLRGPSELVLGDPDATLEEIIRYLQFAKTNLIAGNCLIGPDAADNYDDLTFALPANASAGYCKRKSTTVAERFGDAAQVWEAN